MLDVKKVSVAIYIFLEFERLFQSRNNVGELERQICSSYGHFKIVMLQDEDVLTATRLHVGNFYKLLSVDGYMWESRFPFQQVLKNFHWDDVLLPMFSDLKIFSFRSSVRLEDEYLLFTEKLFNHEAVASYDSGRGYYVTKLIQSEKAFVMIVALRLAQKRFFDDNILEDYEVMDNFRAYLLPILARILKNLGFNELDEDACVALDAVAGYWEHEVFDICRGVKFELEKLSIGN